jgi:carbonic anhydrase
MQLKQFIFVAVCACAASFTVSTVQAGDRPAAHGSQALMGKAAQILLKEGNERFVADAPQHPNAGASIRLETATAGQEPFATVLSCSDSRAPVELIFDRGVGEIFTVRVAGNVADTDEIATMEYGVGHLHTPLLVVMGHTRCGAVTAVAKGAELHGLIPELVDNILPAVKRAKAAGADEKNLIPSAIRENVWQSISDIFRRSDGIKSAVAKGDLTIVGCIYDLDTGKVEWLGEHPGQRTYLAEARKETVENQLTMHVAPPVAREPAVVHELTIAHEPAVNHEPAAHAAPASHAAHAH